MALAAITQQKYMPSDIYDQLQMHSNKVHIRLRRSHVTNLHTPAIYVKPVLVSNR
jgi:hypothetical protein